MAGQGNLARIKDRYASISSNTTLIAGWTYHCTTASTLTLPDPSILSVGDWVKLTKKINITPTIQRNGTELIKTKKGSDTAVFFDIECEVIFVWNGVEWEV